MKLTLDRLLPLRPTHRTELYVPREARLADRHLGRCRGALGCVVSYPVLHLGKEMLSCYFNYYSSRLPVLTALNSRLRLTPSVSFLESQGIILHNLAPQVSLNPHFPPPYCDSGVVPLSGQCELIADSGHVKLSGYYIAFTKQLAPVHPLTPRPPPAATAPDRAADHPGTHPPPPAVELPRSRVLQHGPTPHGHRGGVLA
jgi:hypothetical protein